MKYLTLFIVSILVSVSSYAADPIACNAKQSTDSVKRILYESYSAEAKPYGVSALDLATVSVSNPHMLGFNKKAGRRMCQLQATFSPNAVKTNETWNYIQYAIKHSMATGIPDVVMPRYYSEVYEYIQAGMKQTYLDEVSFDVSYSLFMEEGSVDNTLIKVDLVGPYSVVRIMAASDKFYRNGGK